MLAGTAAGTTLSRVGPNTWTATGPDGTDTLTHVEVVQFADRDAVLPAEAPLQRDFAGGGTAAILWRSEDGEVWQWQTDGQSILAQGGTTLGTDWAIEGTGDFAGTGKAGILWRHAGDGAMWLWQMDGTAIASGTGYVSTVDASWTVLATRDFDGDGKADILWRHDGDNALSLFAMDGATPDVSRSGGIAFAGAPWVPLASGDFDRDGKADILWQNAATQDWYVWAMNGTAFKAQAGLGAVGSESGVADFAVAGVGDVNGDGTEDVLLRSSSTGDLRLWAMSPDLSHAELSVDNPGLAWTVAAMGDYDGDGKADILWRNEDSGDAYLWRMDGNAIAQQHDFGLVASYWQVVH